MGEFGWWDFFKVLLAAALVILGWFFAHRLTSIRDEKNFARNKRSDALAKAYQLLLMVAMGETAIRTTSDGRFIDDLPMLEEAIGIIHLFGNDHQSKLVNKLTSEIDASGDIRLTELIDSLRSDIRELNSMSDLTEIPTYVRTTYFKDGKRVIVR